MITGYLGSGKTTLLNRILTNVDGIRFAVIVNDIGEVNIDASLIQQGGVVGQDESGDLVALQNGCICCTLKMDLVKQIADLIDTGRFDYIVIEASGVCEPEPIAQTVTAMQQMASRTPSSIAPRLDCIVTVVDALRLQSEFGCGGELQRPNLGEDDIENLIISQIEFCNIILLNKISEVSPDEAARTRAVIRALQPKVEIIGCDFADVDLRRLLDTHLFDFERVATSAAWVDGIEREMTEAEEAEARGEHHHEHEHHEHEHHDHDHDNDHHDCHCHHHHHHDGEGEADEYGIGTWVYYRRRPFNFERFDDWVARHWPRNVIRAKGVIYFSHNRDMSLLFEQAGVQKRVTESGYWYATAPADELAALMARDPALRRDWDETYGDRMIKIVFIGRDLDREALASQLDACLD